MPDLLLLHGHGDRPESFAGMALALAGLAVAVPAGPVTVDGGFAWWAEDEDGPSADTLSCVADLAAGCAVVAGFSQGAALALRLGVGAAVVSVAGFLVPGSPRLAAGASLVVIHGEADEVVDPLHGRMVVRRARASGHTVDERWHPGAHVWPAGATQVLQQLSQHRLHHPS